MWWTLTVLTLAVLAGAVVGTAVAVVWGRPGEPRLWLGGTIAFAITATVVFYGIGAR